MLTDLFPGLPPYLLAAAILHLAFVLALILPVWRIFARAWLGGAWSLILLVPVVGLIAVPVMLAAFVMRRAGWPVAWALVAFVPLANVVFLWIFAFARWPATKAARAPRAQAEDAQDMSEDTGRPRVGALESGPAEEPATHRPEPADVEEAAAVSGEELQLERSAAVNRRRTLPLESEDTLTPGQQAEAKAAAEAEPETRPQRRAAGTGRIWLMSGANAQSADIRIRLTEADLDEAAEGLRVGRSSRADFILKDDSVSRNHARFTLQKGKLHVEDLDSMNGTWVDGEKLEPGVAHLVKDGGEIEFGHMKLTVSEA